MKDNFSSYFKEKRIKKCQRRVLGEIGLLPGTAKNW